MCVSGERNVSFWEILLRTKWMVPEGKYLSKVFAVAVKSCCGTKDEAFSASKKLTWVIC